MMIADRLLALVAIPIAAGIVCLVLPERFHLAARLTAVVVSAAALAGAASVFMAKPLTPSAYFAVDNLSSCIALGIAAFTLLTAVYSLGAVDRAVNAFCGYLLMTLGSSFAVTFADHLIVLVVFWGILAALLYLMVILGGTAQSARAAKKALIVIGATDALLIFGVAVIGMLAGTFSIQSARIAIDGVLPLVAYLSVAAACFAKAGAVPFHSWIPDVAEAAPTTVTAYLIASLDKLLGIYFLVRISIGIFLMNDISNTILLVAGSLSIVIGATFTLVQRDYKRLLGYCAVSQVGYMVVGIGTGTILGIAGGLFHMLNHAIYETCLFFSCGVVEKKTLTTDLGKLGGLAKNLPVTFASFFIAALAISGIPPLNGFVSKWMVYQGIIASAAGKSPLWAFWLIAALFGSALTLAAFMRFIHAAFLGRPSPGMKAVTEAPAWATVPMALLALACILFGIFAFTVPIPLFIAPALGRVIAYPGVWQPGPATLLIVAGIVAGLVISLMGRRSQSRTVTSFVGGEDAESLERVTGTDFYTTIGQVKGAGFVYARDAEERLDPYTRIGRSLAPLTRALQYAQNGILPTYLIWALLGLAVTVLVLLLR